MKNRKKGYVNNRERTSWLHPPPPPHPPPAPVGIFPAFFFIYIYIYIHINVCVCVYIGGRGERWKGGDVMCRGVSRIPDDLRRDC